MNDRLSDFATRLTTATTQGAADWTTESASSFVLALPSGAVRIRSVDSDGQFPYELSLFDQDGVMIESLQTDRWEYEEPPQNAPLIALYEAARTNALNIDKVMDNILHDLARGKGGSQNVVKPPPPGGTDADFTAADDDIPF